MSISGQSVYIISVYEVHNYVGTKSNVSVGGTTICTARTIY